MNCYLDKTFCDYKGCFLFPDCSRALNSTVKHFAGVWWAGMGKDGEPPISLYASKPECYFNVEDEL